jgi:hypothetical protein
MGVRQPKGKRPTPSVHALAKPSRERHSAESKPANRQEFQMLKQALAAVATLSALALGTAGPAEAHGDRIDIWKPYVVEKYCSEPDYTYCKARMDYAPFQNAMFAGPGSYWYRKPHQHYHYGYYHHEHRRHSTSRHVRWCMDHYRTYNPDTDMFVGKGYRHYRCNSPYDGM